MKKFFLALLAPFLLAFDTPPVEYQVDAIATVAFASPKDVADLCSEGHDFRAIACAGQTGPNRGVILMPNPCDPAFEGDFYAALMCHEMAHLNGWRHPQ